VHGDAIRLTQVVGNMLDNACKYTPAGGEGRITLRVEASPEQVTIRVRDNGVGVPVEMLGRIFEPFLQVERSSTSAQFGLGIGLSLVKRLVELHGGSVRADSAGRGQGCELSVRLPRLAAAAGVAEGVADAGDGEALAKAVSAVSVPATSGCRILVVDDNRDAASSLATLLELSGNTVATADDGPTAIATAATFEPDAVVLDIGMPEMDGYEVARRLRASPRGDRLRIIAVTGWGQEEDRRRAMAAGIDAYLVKPIEPAALHELLPRST
jgi:CheY-like chemotaxis protein